MEIPPVLMQLLQAGQSLEALLTGSPQGNSVANAGEGSPFALVLAQQAAPAIAAATGNPVLILPDGGIVLEFDLSSIPPGALVVSPPLAQAGYQVTGADGELPEPETSEQEGLVEAASSLVPGMGPSTAMQSTAKSQVHEADAGKAVKVGSGTAGSSAAYRVVAAGSETTATAPVRAGAGEPSAEGTATLQAQAGASSVSGEPSADAAGKDVAAAATAVAESKPQAAGAMPRESGRSPTGRVIEAAELTATVAKDAASRVNGGDLQNATPDDGVSTEASQARGDATPVRHAVARLTSEGVTFEVQTGAVDGSSNGLAGKGVMLRDNAAKSGVAPDSVAGANPPGEGQSSQADVQSNNGDSPHSRDTNSLADTIDEAFVRHVMASKVAADTPSVRLASETPQAPLPQNGTAPAVPAESVALPAAVNVSHGTPTAEHAAGDVAGYRPPSGAALHDSLTDLAVKSVRYLVSEGEHAIRVRLVPESLGEVRVEIVSVRDELHLKLVSGNSAVRDAMETGSDALRNALSRDGVNVVRVTVSADGGPSQGHGSFAGRGQWNQGHDGSRYGGSSHRSYNAFQDAPGERATRTAYHDGSLSVYA